MIMVQRMGECCHYAIKLLYLSFYLNGLLLAKRVCICVRAFLS